MCPAPRNPTQRSSIPILPIHIQVPQRIPAPTISQAIPKILLPLGLCQPILPIPLPPQRNHIPRGETPLTPRNRTISQRRKTYPLSHNPTIIHKPNSLPLPFTTARLRPSPLHNRSSQGDRRSRRVRIPDPRSTRPHHKIIFSGVKPDRHVFNTTERRS